MKILAIDDHADNLTALKAVLTELFPESVFLSALNGPAGLDLARSEDPDVILLDIVMPGMDGYAVCQKVKKDERLQTIPVLFLTALQAARDDRVKALDAGAEGFLTKPLDRIELAVQIRAMAKIKSASLMKRNETERLAGLVAERTRALQLSQSATLNLLEDLKTEIEARKISEAALQESEKRHRTILQTAMDGIWLADLEGRLLEVNDTYCRMSGYSAQELLTMRIPDLESLEDATATAARIQTIMRHGEARFESRHRRKDGSLFDVLVSVQYRPDDKGLMVAFVQDITERKRAEEERHNLQAQLIQAQRMEAIGTLASGVAHEINNPLMGVINYTQLILDTLGPDSPVSEYAVEIVKESARVTTIVKNLLAFSRQDNQESCSTSVHALVNNTLSLIRTVMKHDDVALQLDLPDGMPDIRCRVEELRQVLMNLLTNARDALNDKYPGPDPDKVIWIRTVRLDEGGKPLVRITVEDHGPGIPPAIRERIFDPFFTTKPRGKGTGLGLSISHGIVKDHGGRLWVESEAGRWTRFHIDLPAGG